MTDIDDPTMAAEPDIAAAELALGLLDGDERAAALRRLLAEPAFARDVERWREHFSTLFAAIPEVEPSPHLADRVIARLDGPVRAQPGYWKPLALASSLIAASLLAVVVVQPQPAAVSPPVIAQAPPQAPAPMVAAFMLEGQDAPTVATYDPGKGQLTLPASIDVPAGRAAQLWAIEGSGAPQPLGMFRQAGDRIAADARAAMTPGIVFAISIEPPGGSPTGAPTGPVIGTGTLVRT